MQVPVRSQAAHHRDTGQALVEFLIAATLVLIPTFLVIPLLGKYMDIKATTIQAARYAAWERTVWFGHADWSAAQKTDLEIQREIQQRFYSNTATAKIQSNQRNADSGWVGGPKPLWKDRAGNPMLVTYDSDVTQVNARGETPGLMNEVLDPIVSAVSAAGGVLGAAFTLDMDSLYTSSVNVKTATTRPIKQVIHAGAATGAYTPLFSDRNVLIANGWTGRGATHVKTQTEGLTPTSFFQRSPMSDILTIVQYVATILAPELNPNHLKIGGEVKPDVVPDDRLQ